MRSRRFYLGAKLTREMVSFTGRQLLSQVIAGRKGFRKQSADLPDLRSSTIALVKLDAIGDFVLATGFLRLLHENIPAAKVSFICSKPVGALVRREFPGWNVIELGKRDMLQARKTRIKLRSFGPFQLLIDLRALRALSETLASSWIPAEFKLGLLSDKHETTSRFWGERAIFDRLLVCRTPELSGDICVDIANYAQLAEFLFPDLIAEPPLPNLTVTPAQQQGLARHVASSYGIDITVPFLLVCPGSLQRIKEYPVLPLADVVRDVAITTDIQVVVSGGQSDVRTTRPLMEHLAGVPGVNDLSGKLDLEQHVVLTSMAAAALTMDSATAHIAGALNRPAVVLLGGGYPGVFAPWGESDTFRWLQNRLPCYGCRWRCIQSRPMCIEDIPTDAIKGNLLEILRI